MDRQATLILESALKLPDEDRAALLERLFDSFGTLQDKKSEEARIAETESRIEAYDAGKLKSISEDEAYTRLNLKS